MRNRITGIFLILMVLAAGFAYAGGQRERADEAPPETESADETRQADTEPGTTIGTRISRDEIATVNGVGILREDFETAVAQTSQRFQMQGQPVSEAQMEEFRAEILEQLIAEELLYQDALSRGLEVSDDAVEAQFRQIRGQFQTDEEWEQALEANNTSESELREQIRRGDLIQQVVETAVADSAVAEITDAEVQEFYDDHPEFFDQGEQIAARHIIISTQGMESEAEIAEARERIEAIRQELLAGADFAELAREHSDDGSALQGGDLGTFGRGQMVPEFEQAAFALEEGEISGIVRTQFGFHIVQVTERMDTGLVPIAEVSQSIREYLGQQKQADALSEYVERLREEADVVVKG